MIGTISPRITLEAKALDISLGKDVPNQDIGKVLNRTVLLGGKRFRPILIFLISDFFELPLKIMAPFARAIELTHSATLAHDDVIDQATERRGKKSLNVLASNKKAILSGDYLMAQTIFEISRSGNIQLIQELTRVILDLVEGEWLQIENVIGKEITEDKVKQVAIKKTASTITWCCIAPAIKAGACDEVLAIMRSFGNKLGLAFQAIDDVIDFNANLDKNVLQDIRNNTFNFVTYALVKNNPQLKNQIAQIDFDATVISLPWSAKELETAISEVRKKAKSLLNDCKLDLQKVLHLQNRAENKKAQRASHCLEELLHFLADRTQ